MNIENKIYEILENHEIRIDGYEWGTDEEVAMFLIHQHIPYQHIVAPYPNEEGGVAFFSWIENNKLYSVAFDMYKF